MLADDFTETFDNDYGISAQTDPVRYYGFKSTFIDPYMRIFAGLGEADAPEGHDYSEGAEAYLRAGGMSDEEILRLKQLPAG